MAQNVQSPVMATQISPQQELDLELKQLSARDLSLRSIGVLVVTIIATGFLCLVAPNLLWRGQTIKIDSEYLPQLISGFIVLVVLFNIYLLDQKRRMDRSRQALISRLMAEACLPKSLLDPATQTFARTFLPQALEKAAEDAESYRNVFTLLQAVVSNFASVRRRFGEDAGDHVVMVLSQILKNSFRGSDLICRTAGAEFTVILLDTNEHQAQPPVARIMRAVDKWNITSDVGYKLWLNIGICESANDSDPSKLLEEVRHRCLANQYQPAFPVSAAPESV
jgi:diguanylate cyclase (GGDEF)-like protein